MIELGRTATAQPEARSAMADPRVEEGANTDLFALGRAAWRAARDATGDRVVFARARQLLPTGAWRGPRDAADAYVEEEDLAALGGLAGALAVTGGVRTLVASSIEPLPRAHAAGVRILLRVPFAADLSEPTRLARLRAIARHAPLIDGVIPTPVGEPLGLDALRFVALCRLHAGATHVVLDFARMGHRLAQMGLGFGGNELFGPIVSERALRLGDNVNNPALTRKEAALLVRGARLVPFERVSSGAVEEVVP